MGGKIAGYIFTVVIPIVVTAMLPHIGPEIGFPIILVSLVIGLSDFAWMYSKSHHRGPNMLLIGGMALGALVFGGCAITFFLAPKSPGTASAQPTVQDVSILADCSDTFLPMYVPADGRIMDAFVIFNDDVNRVKITAMNYQGKPGEPLNWLAAKQSPFGWKCELTAQQPIFDAVLTLDVTVIENIRKPDPSGQISNYSGIPIGKIKEMFNRHRIDSNSTVFYLVNQSSYFVNVEVQRVASGGIINKFGSHERRNDIAVNSIRHASMGPFIVNTPQPTTPPAPPHQDEAAEGGKGGSGEIFGNDGTIIGGKGGNVGLGGVGSGGEGGGGVIHGDGGTIIGGEGGSVDGTNIWFPPAQSGYIRYLETQGQTPDFGVQYPGAGGATAGWLQCQQVVVKIREEYFKKTRQEAKIRSSKIEDVPLEYINEKLKQAGYQWRARIEKKYWYLYYVPNIH